MQLFIVTERNIPYQSCVGSLVYLEVVTMISYID